MSTNPIFPSSTGARRPCLKRSSSSTPPPAPLQRTPQLPARTVSLSRVHFPPTPALSTTFPTHSKTTYDRRPLVVQPNDCALPARGCRTYVLERAHSYAECDDVHTEEREQVLLAPPSLAPAPVTPVPRALPALVPDHGPSSSESDESDAIASPHSGRFLAAPTPAPTTDQRLLFLPHPPSPELKPRKERDKERRRRRDAEEERGCWKTGVRTSDDLAGSCFGGF